MNELTREKILDMPAGKELNALVAEHVMGWKVGISNGHMFIQESESDWEWLEEYTPSSDISAAWEVLDKLKDMGAEINVGFYEKWDCSIDYPIGCNYREVAETAQEAICKCALMAVMAL